MQPGKFKYFGDLVGMFGGKIDNTKAAVNSVPQSAQAEASHQVLQQASQGLSAAMSAVGPEPASSAGQTPATASPAASRAGGTLPAPASSQGLAMTASIPVIPGVAAGVGGSGVKPGTGGAPILVPGKAEGAGGTLLMTRDPREVLLETSQLLDENPGDTKARADRAQAFAEVGDFDAAVAEATKALETDPVSIKALNARAYANNKRGQYAFALQDADQLVKLDPSNAMAHLNRAMALEGLDRMVEALDEYLLAAQLDPSLKTFLADAEARAAARPSSGTGRRLSVLARAALGGLAVFFVAGGALFWRSRRKAAAAKPAPALAVGDGAVIGDNYRINRLIGEGGMGKVFEGFDTTIRRKVAIKMMRPELRQAIGDAQVLDEARLAALVRHPNVVEVFAAIQERGEIFLVFDFVEGKPLHALLQARRRFSLAEARHILGQVAAGLDCAHGKRVIHRDLKPANVVISNEGVAKLMDFGIAHRSGPAGASEGSLGVAGTRPYMAPEQHMGSACPESDIYALGVVAYELLTGRRPFDGPEQLEKKQRMEFVPAVILAPGLAAGVDAALKRALAADPKARFHSGKEFVDALPAG